MEHRITVLAEDVASKIAAGEVIERPSSIVKELLENSLDAGATEIIVELKGGGKEAIRVADNGAGIEPADVPLAFERHATSKIRTVADLYDVRSFGFRGEALPSIAAVSRVELLTRRRGETAGTRFIVENGRVLANEAAGCPEGTTIAVDRIFDSLPVRKKFLRQDATEQGHCMDIIVRVLLPHGRVRARVLAGSRVLLEIPQTEKLHDRIVHLLGSDLRHHLVAVEETGRGMRLSGYLTRPDFTRSSTKAMFFYINGRYVRDPLLSQAVMNACRNLLEARRYPACALFIDVPPETIDVNVHPAKLEVRFRNPQDVRDLLHRGLTVALSGVRPAAHAPAISPAAGNAGYRERIGVHEALRRYSLSAGVALRTPEATASRTPDDVPGFSPVQGGLFGSTAAERHGSTFSSLDFLGQFEGTYLVFSAPGAMILLDQHAAHERVLYERLRHSRQGDLEIQSLLIPEILELGPREMDLLVSSGDLLRRAGFEIEAFGERSIIIKSMPSMLGPTDVKGLVADIFESIADPGLPGDEKLDRIFIGMACRGAIKAHQVLTIEEVRRLCSDLDSIPFASNCPHGRPVFIEFPASAVEKLFKRT